MAVSFEYRGTSFCFVNAHLAAHQDKKERRDEDYSEIVENIRLGLKKQEILTDFHYVVWMGDLNYRVDFGNQVPHIFIFCIPHRNEFDDQNVFVLLSKSTKLNAQF